MDNQRTDSQHPSSHSHSQSSQPPKPSTNTPHRGPTKATRRIRGEIACAECRRLKIRCDRTIPCSTCVKRGCGALCPNGTIPPGEGSRFVLAATDHLRHKLTRMEARMRSLEDALAIIHSAESDGIHPLLSETTVEDREEGSSATKNIPEEDSEVQVPLSESLGTLWLDHEGGSRFFGPYGGSESLLQSSAVDSLPDDSKGPALQELDPSYLSPEINQCYQSFPFTPPNVLASSVQSTVESFLPSMDRAITLCDTFLEHLSWMFHIVSRHELVNELIPIIYKQNPVPYGPHDLALLLIVLGIGSLVDLNLPPYNLEAQHYYRLARATLAIQNVLGAQSVVTIKVLHLMSIYNGMSGKETNLEQSYMLLDLAGQVALRIGFHIDPSMWGFEGRETYDRRVYFWNLISGVLWQSLVTGRPPSLLMSYIDCQIPSPEDENLYQEGEVPLGFGIWGFKASAECLIPLARLALAAKPPSYDSVMDLDRKIRELALPRSDFAQNQPDRTAMSMLIFVRSHYQELMLLFLHRAYFAQAMMEHGENPLSSPYSQSVVAAYSCACVVLQDTRDQFMKKPLLCARIWRIWSFTFSAAVIVGTIAIRGAHMNLKPPALGEFEAICQVFSSAAKTSSRAARALPVLQAMLERAHEAHTFNRQQGKPALGTKNIEDVLYVGAKNKSQSTSSTSGAKQKEHKISTYPTTPIEMRRLNPVSPGAIPVHPQSHYRSSAPVSPDLMRYPPRITHYDKKLHESHQQAHSLLHASGAHSAPPLQTPSLSSVHRAPLQALPPLTSQVSEASQLVPDATFADLSQGWNGLFHEVPSHYESWHSVPSIPTAVYQDDPGIRSVSVNASMETETEQLTLGRRGGSQYDGQYVEGGGGSDQVMLDDRWVSFMNYGVMGQHAAHRATEQDDNHSGHRRTR